MKFKNGSIVLGLLLSHAVVNAAAPMTSNDMVLLHGKGETMTLQEHPHEGTLPRITVVNDTGSLIILQTQTGHRSRQFNYSIIGQGQESKYFELIGSLGVKDARAEGDKALDKASYWSINYDDIWDHPNEGLIVTIKPAKWLGSDPFVIEKKWVPMARGGHWYGDWILMSGIHKLAKEQGKSESK